MRVRLVLPAPPRSTRTLAVANFPARRSTFQRGSASVLSQTVFVSAYPVRLPTPFLPGGIDAGRSGSTGVQGPTQPWGTGRCECNDQTKGYSSTLGCITCPPGSVVDPYGCLCDDPLAYFDEPNGTCFCTGATYNRNGAGVCVACGEGEQPVFRSRRFTVALTTWQRDESRRLRWLRVSRIDADVRSNQQQMRHDT